MRKFATTALTALTIGLLGSTAAFADAPNQGWQGSNNHGPAYNQQQNHQPGAGGPGNGQWNQHPQGGQQGDHRFDSRRDNDRFGDRRFDNGRNFNDRRFKPNFNFQLYFGNFDRWERGWGYGSYQTQYRYQRPLSAYQIERQLERQGYYDVRNLQKSRAGFGYRAFAVNYRGQPVMLRVNPFTGGVMEARYI